MKKLLFHIRYHFAAYHARRGNWKYASEWFGITPTGMEER